MWWKWIESLMSVIEQNDDLMIISGVYLHPSVRWYSEEFFILPTHWVIEMLKHTYTRAYTKTRMQIGQKRAIKFKTTPLNDPKKLVYFHYIAMKLRSSNAPKHRMRAGSGCMFTNFHIFNFSYVLLFSMLFCHHFVCILRFFCLSLTLLFIRSIALSSTFSFQSATNRYKGSNSVKVNKNGIHTGVWNKHTDGKRENKQILVAVSFELQLQPAFMRMHTHTLCAMKPPWLVHYPMREKTTNRRAKNRINQMIYALPYEHLANNNNHKFLLF